jgi:hypothetical protein
VDLEDRLVYGLTPVRFGYLVVAVVGAMSIWGLRWLPPPARLVPCLLLVTAAVVLAWGRWRGRPLDRLMVDVAVFLRRNYRLQVGFGVRPWARPRPSRLPSAPSGHLRPRGGEGQDRPPGVASVSFTAINTLGRRRSPARRGGAE